MMNCLSNNVHACMMDTCEQMCNTKDLNVFFVRKKIINSYCLVFFLLIHSKCDH